MIVSTSSDVPCASHSSSPRVPFSNHRSRHNANKRARAFERNTDYVCLHSTFSIQPQGIILTMADLLHFSLVFALFKQPLRPLSTTCICPNCIHLAYSRCHCPVSLALGHYDTREDPTCGSIQNLTMRRGTNHEIPPARWSPLYKGCISCPVYVIDIGERDNQ